MQIYFIGQRGLPAQSLEDSMELRTQALAEEAIKNGHEAIIAYNPSYSRRESRTMSHIRLLKFPSFNPTIPGGYLYAFLSACAAFSLKPDTIHVQGWKSAIMVRMLLPFLPATPVIWTISSLPGELSPLSQWIFRIWLRIIVSKFAAICVPSRTLQYVLLATYSLKAMYIPDGCHAPALRDILSASLGYRREQYGVLLSQNTASLRKILRVYTKTKSKKKLLLFIDNPSDSLKRLSRTYPVLNIVPLPLLSRSAQSLVRQAGFVLITDPVFSPLLLQAMDAGRTIIATTHPIHEEILGTTGAFYAEGDQKHLETLLRKVVKRPVRSPETTIRAQNHFSWGKAGQEYDHIYAPSRAKMVPFDSIVRKNSFPLAS